jgi:hypothetical protein
VVTVSLPVLQGRIDSASLALGGPINADIPATHKLFPSSSAPEVNHSTSAAPATPSPPRSAAQSLSANADVPSSVVQYPPAWCEIHHIVHWADNGPTSIENCVALCGRHHRLLHHSHWRIHMIGGIVTPDLTRIRQ